MKLLGIPIIWSVADESRTLWGDYLEDEVDVRDRSIVDVPSMSKAITNSDAFWQLEIRACEHTLHHKVACDVRIEILRFLHW